MVNSLLGLQCIKSVEPAKYEKDYYELTFSIDCAVVTIRIGFSDYCGADLIITNMTTLPDDAKGQGFGSQALQTLLCWANEHNMSDIRAVQVQEPSESFWIKNKFVKMPEPNQCNDFRFDG